MTAYDCREVFSRLDDYLDRELSHEEIRLVEEHLATCRECALEERFEAKMLELLKEKMRRISVPSGLLSNILKQLPRE